MHKACWEKLFHTHNKNLCLDAMTRRYDSLRSLVTCTVSRPKLSAQETSSIHITGSKNIIVLTSNDLVRLPWCYCLGTPAGKMERCPHQREHCQTHWLTRRSMYICYVVRQSTPVQVIRWQHVGKQMAPDASEYERCDAVAVTKAGLKCSSCP